MVAEPVEVTGKDLGQAASDKKDSATYASRPIRVNGCGIFFRLTLFAQYLLPIVLKELYWTTERSDARGLGRPLPNAPPGLSRKGLGVKGKRTQCVATQGVWGDRSPMPHRGCPEGTGGERYRAKLLTALLRRRDRLRRQGLGRCRSGWSVPHQRRRSKVSCFQEDASEETRWRRCWR